MGTSDPESKPFQIPKQLVWKAYKSVKANDGAAGVDGCSVEDFEKDLKGNLYKEAYSKPQIIEKKNSPRAASYASR